MECERLQRLVKNWYAQVQDEAMATARMVLFMESHIADCHTCLADPLIRQEVEKITAIILPPSKVRKAAAGLDDEAEALQAEPEEAEESDDAGEDEGDSEEIDEEELGEEEFGDDEEEEDEDI